MIFIMMIFIFITTIILIIVYICLLFLSFSFFHFASVTFPNPFCFGSSFYFSGSLTACSSCFVSLSVIKLISFSRCVLRFPI